METEEKGQTQAGTEEGQGTSPPADSKGDDPVVAAVMSKVQKQMDEMRSTYDKKLAEKDRELRRYRGASEFSELDEETRASHLDAAEIREDLVDHYVSERGVPKSVFKFARTPKQAREAAADYFAENGGKKGDAGPDIKELVRQALAEAQGASSGEKSVAPAATTRLPNRVTPGGGMPSPATGNYRDLIAPGKPMPSAAEIDRLTAHYLNR